MTEENPVIALNETDLADFNAAQKDEASVHSKATTFQATRAVAYFNRHKLVQRIGVEVIANHVEQSMGFKVDKLRLKDKARLFQICAMGILNLDVLNMQEETQKKEANNRIADLRKALEALNHFADEIAGMSDEMFADYFAEKEGLSGLYRDFVADTKGSGDKKPDEDGALSTIEGMIGNPTGFEVANVKMASGFKLYVANGEGDTMRLVPLEVTSEFIAKLANKVPDPMTNANSRVVLFREMLTTAASIVPDGKSNIPVVSLEDGEKLTNETPMLDANQFVRVTDGTFSIARSRVEDTIVMDVTPDDEELREEIAGDWFIDTKTRKNLLAKLVVSSDAAKFTNVKSSPINGESGAEVRLAFQQKSDKARQELILKTANRMGSVFTMKVVGFAPVASAGLSEEQRKEFVTEFFGLAVKSREDHAITVGIKDNGLTFRFGSAKSVKVATATTEGEATGRVAKQDFVRAVSGLLALPIDGELRWMIDPKGLLAIEASTASATYRVHIQLLRTETDPKAQNRERALLERVVRSADAQTA